jgi:hypothetical protein
MKKLLNIIILVLYWIIPKKIICFFFRHKNVKQRLAAKRLENDKKGKRIVYDIYERVVCVRCGKRQELTNRRGKTKAERMLCKGLSFEQAVIFTPSLKNQK